MRRRGFWFVIVVLQLLVALPAARNAVAQTDNFIELAKVDAYTQYTDCYGYKDPETGKEYAILATTEGIAIYNIEDPFAPILKGFFFGVTGNPYRDVTVYNERIYGVSVGINSGIQIIDISNPEAPVARPTYGAFTGRDLIFDTASATGYVIGWHPTSPDQGPNKDASSAEAMMVPARAFKSFSFANPESPVPLVEYIDPFFHNAALKNGKLYGAAVDNGGRFDIIRVSNPPDTSHVASTTYPGGRSHGIAVSSDGNTCFVSDELPGGGRVRAFDVSDSSDIIEISTFGFISGMSPHNIEIKNDTLWCAWYEVGLRVFDVRNPSSAALLGTFDTGPDTAGVLQGFTGCYGVYPHLPSGVIVTSDLVQGMHLVYYSPLIGTLSGTVTDLTTGAPLSGAQVRIPDFFNRRITTLGPGTYSATLPGGTHQVIATKTGYYADTLSAVITDGQVTNLNIALVPLSATGIPGAGDSRPATLEAPSPNPAREATMLSFRLPRDETVSLVVYDASGRQVRTIASGRFPSGRHSVPWDGRDDRGALVGSGAFFARLDTGGVVRTAKLVLTR